ncbi:TetR/AcrR family transcriptional regulator [Agromyces archimandritae]|uniref:TetR/AcrR family transcriptional regulator n=1 Tax=Agromyces archimandritae TaxID=2781962 RepID=A0A975IPA2_9MICO|nr:TetR family transcriptional regulator C-terminal domain-containing protein [Agromyces archimandritae]QTX05375.1 TetR/AcrR family transcriptional regulator [Agromyces archimandritae]
MPRIVDKDARRDEIIDVTWRIIEREGVDAVTLRRVAAEQGLANGAVKPYFASKDELLEAAYLRAFARTNERAEAAIGELAGLEALRRLAAEIMPLDEERRTEARIVVAFWERAVSNERLARIYRTHTCAWLGELARHLAAARDAGEVTASTPDTVVLDRLMWMMTGLQAMSRLAPELASPERQRAALDELLDGLAGE